MTSSHVNSQSLHLRLRRTTLHVRPEDRLIFQSALVLFELWSKENNVYAHAQAVLQEMERREPLHTTNELQKNSRIMDGAAMAAESAFSALVSSVRLLMERSEYDEQVMLDGIQPIAVTEEGDRKGLLFRLGSGAHVAEYHLRLE